MELVWILCGVMGATIAGIATFCVMRGWLCGTGITFPALSIGCSILILMSLYGEFSLSLLVIELFWVSFSTYALIRAMR